MHRTSEERGILVRCTNIMSVASRFVFVLFIFLLKCLDCLFGSSLFFTVTYVTKGERMLTGNSGRHTGDFLIVPPAATWFLGQRCWLSELARASLGKPLRDILGAPSRGQPCCSSTGRPGLCSLGHTGLCIYGIWPDPTSSHLRWMKTSRNLAKIRKNQGHFLKDLVITRSCTSTTQRFSLASYVTSIKSNA